MKKVTLYSVVAFTLSVLLFIAACGGSNSNSSSVATTTISGSVFAAPVAGATVVVLNSSGTTTIAGPVTTLSDGTYSVSVPTAALASDLIISSTSGTFTDEATGTTDVTAGNMAAYVAGGSLSTGSAVHLDPSSTVIADLVKNHGQTLDPAKTAFSGAFGYTPDTSVAPKNAPSSTGATAAQRLAALRAFAFSQLTNNLGLTPDKQFDLMAAIAQDLADDGKLNGSAGSVNGTNLTEDIQNRFERSLVSFQTNTTCNLTGLAADQIGSLPFSKVALTNAYRIEYIPGMMPAAQGKTTFKLKITKRSDGLAASGLTVSLMPLMHMSTKNHTTPVDSIAETAAGSGEYTCTVYYLMSSMMNGMSMGFWELKVTIGGGMGGETAYFFPFVDMSMGDTSRATLKGVTDLISAGTGTEKRSYFLFNDGLVSGSTFTFNLFIAAKESMMSFPAVSEGTSLHDETGTAWTVNPMTVSASTDGTTWIDATDNTGGHWSVGSLSGLSSGVTGTIYVKLNVNGDQKTLDGLVSNATGTNTYASFTVTPQ